MYDLSFEWLTDWRRTEPLAQLDYVKGELARLAAAGEPVLTRVLTLPLPVQVHACMVALVDHDALPGHRWYVRLVEGAVPHDKDPQGRDLPLAKRGKVEVVKVGTKGGQLRNTSKLPGAVTDAFNGPATQQAAVRGQDIYVCREIGRDPVELSLHDASLVLSRYGYGVPLKRYWNRSPTSPGWDAWIIEELAPAVAEDLLLEKRAREREAKGAAKKSAA
ncbi:MAG TPA: hypothetical protein VIU16_12465 [Gaiellaceae bacterium]